MCHNDLHPGSVMINEVGEIDPDQLVFIDYANAGYGYRIFDLAYNVMNWPWVVDADTNERWFNAFIADYVDERQKLGDTAITIEQMNAEWFAHTPYMILERLVFAVAIEFPDKDVITALGYLYADEARKRGHTVQYSSSSVALPRSSIIMLLTPLMLR